MPPSRQPWCNVCPAGWATTAVDQSHCDMCIPGTYADAPQSPACGQCPPGTYADSWGSTHCNHCIIGTYTPYQVSPPPPLIPPSPQAGCHGVAVVGFRV